MQWSYPRYNGLTQAAMVLFMLQWSYWSCNDLTEAAMVLLKLQWSYPSCNDDDLTEAAQSFLSYNGLTQAAIVLLKLQWSHPSYNGLTQAAMVLPKRQWSYPSCYGLTLAAMLLSRPQWSYPSRNGLTQAAMVLPKPHHCSHIFAYSTSRSGWWALHDRPASSTFWLGSVWINGEEQNRHNVNTEKQLPQLKMWAANVVFTKPCAHSRVYSPQPRFVPWGWTWRFSRTAPSRRWSGESGSPCPAGRRFRIPATQQEQEVTWRNNRWNSSACHRWDTLKQSSGFARFCNRYGLHGWRNLSDSAGEGLGDFHLILPTHVLCVDISLIGSSSTQPMASQNKAEASTFGAMCFEVSMDLPCGVGRNLNSQRRALSCWTSPMVTRGGFLKFFQRQDFTLNTRVD